MSLVLESRVAIITGANQGLGETIARAFVQAGANVMLCARDESKLAEVQSKLQRSLQNRPTGRSDAGRRFETG